MGRFLVAWVLFLCAVAALLAAPVKVKPKKPVLAITAASFVGEWDFSWSGCPGTCQIAKGGEWTAQWSGNAWTGVWRFENGKFHVTEWTLNPDGTIGMPVFWAVTFEAGSLKGKITSGVGEGGEFSLSPVVKIKPDA